MATINATRGKATGTIADDTFNLTAQAGTGQIHSYDPGGDDVINLQFNGIDRFSHGHHVRGGTGDDVFNFTNLDEVNDTIVGRIQDFDPTRDIITIDGVTLDFNALPTNVRMVSYLGDHNDLGAYDQTWLLIDTGPGKIFYALEGARVDMTLDGGSNNGTQERHFMQEGSLPDFATLSDTTLIDQNSVPAGFTPDGGLVINDADADRDDVLQEIQGGSNGDLIAGGINDDTVNAFAGNDVVWGGSGHDYLDGNIGEDTLFGGSGNDTLMGDAGFDLLDGGEGDDLLDGGHQADNLYGRAGNDDLLGGGGLDRLFGGDGDDRLYGGDGDDGHFGEAGNDTAWGGDGDDLFFGGHGDDILMGEAGNDTLNGGAGFDTLTGGSGDDLMQGKFNADSFVFEAGHGHDTIQDFEAENSFEVLDFSQFDGLNSTSDVLAVSRQEGANVVIDTGADSSIILQGVDIANFGADDLVF